MYVLGGRKDVLLRIEKNPVCYLDKYLHKLCLITIILWDRYHYSIWQRDILILRTAELNDVLKDTQLGVAILFGFGLVIFLCSMLPRETVLPWFCCWVFSNVRCLLVTQSCPTLCDPVYGSATTRLLCPRNPPGTNTGVRCHSFSRECEVRSS